MKFAGKWRELEEIIVAQKDTILSCRFSFKCNCYMLQICNFVYLTLDCLQRSGIQEVPLRGRRGRAGEVATVGHM